MSREIRRVPAHWQHPVNSRGELISLKDGFTEAVTGWDLGKEKWGQGLRRDYFENTWVPVEEEHKGLTFEEWNGERPVQSDYMPDWPEEERTHLQMYETCSEGSPISPVFATPEECARWLTDNNASAFGNMTATYGQWLATCRKGYAVGLFVGGGKPMRSGVELNGEDAL